MKSYKYDKHNRVVDSVKGKAEINPKTYKGDVYTQTWIDSRKLATLSIWLDEGGYRTRFLGEVVKFTIDLIIDHLVDTKAVEMIEFTGDARNILEAKYNANLNPGDRGKNIVIHNLTLDGRVQEGKVGGYNPDSAFPFKPKENEEDSVQPKDNGHSNKGKDSPVVSKELLDKAIKTFDERKDKAYDRLIEDAKAQKEEIMANSDIDENGVITPHPGSRSANVGEEEMKEHEERERKKKVQENNEKEIRRIEKRIERKRDKSDDIKEKEDG